ncbi:hypothetical protein ACJIZ3_003555 [Penstemon smallii]|uniref:Uncharacterized protein n=1 Tax=Penstemon smallii TaxID=265156 RepID=A0ABD3U9J6_9LAMI
MDSFIDEHEESRFFDATEHITQESDFVSDCNWSKHWEYDVWINPPQSVEERRKKFCKWMNSSLDGFEEENSIDTDRVMENSGAVLRTEDEFSTSRSSMSSWNSDDLEVNLSEFGNVDVNSNSRSECNEDVIKIDSQLSPSLHGNSPKTAHKLKDKLLRRLRSMSCIMSENDNDDNVGANNFSQVQSTRIHRVKVRHSRRKSKDLSALFMGQDIQAHEGAILSMKFSLDGQYLASAGEDKVVRVWQIIEDERSDIIDVPDLDPSCVYLSVNPFSELGPFTVEKDNINKLKSLRRTQDSACIIFPPKVFRILEKPLHEFKGHKEEILDLSWSNNNCLLSSSVDKTVRLWRVGVNECLKVFSHSDYVTCIQFNPVNDDYFISGSIDGKARVWSISGCQVVDWTETKDLISAVSYRPDGQGGVIGCITGNCRFFNLSDNHFQMETQLCLASKKKSPCKRITSFQFLQQDPSKVLVTCADSQVRIIDGSNVVGKYKGLRNTGNQISASFTSDGKHIISASEDSNVYIWNYIGKKESKSTKSFECFSSDSSIAIPWSGLKGTNSKNGSKSNKLRESSINSLLSQEFLDSSSKISATWPEENLPVSSRWALGKSEYKLVKSCCQSSSNSSHAWGLVMVTAGWDGKIKSYHNYGLPVPL